MTHISWSSATPCLIDVLRIACCYTWSTQVLRFVNSLASFILVGRLVEPEPDNGGLLVDASSRIVRSTALMDAEV